MQRIFTLLHLHNAFKFIISYQNLCAHRDVSQCIERLKTTIAFMNDTHNLQLQKKDADYQDLRNVRTVYVHVIRKPFIEVCCVHARL